MNGGRMQFLRLNAKIAVNGLSSLRMKSPDTVLDANRRFIMTGKIMAAANGVHPHRRIPGISVPDSKGRKTGFTGTILPDHIGMQTDI